MNKKKRVLRKYNLNILRRASLFLKTCNWKNLADSSDEVCFRELDILSSKVIDSENNIHLLDEDYEGVKSLLLDNKGAVVRFLEGRQYAPVSHLYQLYLAFFENELTQEEYAILKEAYETTQGYFQEKIRTIKNNA